LTHNLIKLKQCDHDTNYNSDENYHSSSESDKDLEKRAESCEFDKKKPILNKIKKYSKDLGHKSSVKNC